MNFFPLFLGVCRVQLCLFALSAKMWGWISSKRHKSSGMFDNLHVKFNITPAALSSSVKARWHLRLSQKSHVLTISVWQRAAHHSTRCCVIVRDWRPFAVTCIRLAVDTRVWHGGSMSICCYATIPSHVQPRAVTSPSPKRFIEGIYLFISFHVYLFIHFCCFCGLRSWGQQVEQKCQDFIFPQAPDMISQRVKEIF